MPIKAPVVSVPHEPYLRGMLDVSGYKAAVRRVFEILDTLDAVDEVIKPELAADWREVMNTMPFSEHRIKITDMVAEGD